jgi:hypothetical protein
MSTFSISFQLITRYNQTVRSRQTRLIGGILKKCDRPARNIQYVQSHIMRRHQRSVCLYSNTTGCLFLQFFFPHLSREAWQIMKNRLEREKYYLRIRQRWWRTSVIVKQPEPFNCTDWDHNVYYRHHKSSLLNHVFKFSVHFTCSKYPSIYAYISLVTSFHQVLQQNFTLIFPFWNIKMF